MARGYFQDVSWFSFYNRPIVSAYNEDHGYVVPMKHIVEEHLGLNWEKQRQRISQTIDIVGDEGELLTVSLFHPVLVDGYDLVEGLNNIDHEFPEEDIPVFSSKAQYVCLPLSEINIFLAQINLYKVREEARANLYRYQSECALALHEYWFRGFSINGRKDPSHIDGKRDSWNPRSNSTSILERTCTKYSNYALRMFDMSLDPSAIKSYVSSAIDELLCIDEEVLDSECTTVSFLIAFMEKAANDVIHRAIEINLSPEQLPDTLTACLGEAWGAMNGMILAVESPYDAFGVGRGLPRSNLLK